MAISMHAETPLPAASATTTIMRSSSIGMKS